MAPEDSELGISELSLNLSLSWLGSRSYKKKRRQINKMLKNIRKLKMSSVGKRSKEKKPEKVIS